MSEWDSVAGKVNFNLEISVNDFTVTVDKEAKVLDFGCGYGRITNQLFKLGYNQLIGVDSSIEMINRGLNEYPYLDLRCLSDVILPFSDNEFDSIVTCAVFTCIPKQDLRDQIVREFLRVLQPDGSLYLAEFSSTKSLRFTSGTGVPMWHSQHSELENMLNGFNIELSRTVESLTMSGHASNVSHIIARKII